MELLGLSPNFHTDVSVSDLYIPTIGLLILLQELCGPILGICKWLTYTWMWKLGLRRRNSFSGNTQTGFSMQWVDPILDSKFQYLCIRLPLSHTFTDAQLGVHLPPPPPMPPVQLQSADAQAWFDSVIFGVSFSDDEPFPGSLSYVICYKIWVTYYQKNSLFTPTITSTSPLYKTQSLVSA